MYLVYCLLAFLIWQTPLISFILFILVFGSITTLYKNHQRRQPVDWYNLREALSYWIDLFGKVWYGYEIKGLQNIPNDEAVMIVFYHAALPNDMILFVTRMYRNGRIPWTVVADFSKTFPNARNFMDFCNLVPGGFDRCEQLLKEKQCLLVSPGGVYETIFSDDTYHILWGERLGFAKLALKTKVRIIPAFTKNAREAWVAIKMFDGFWKMLYEKTRWNIKLIYGGLPVKLTTVLGEEISISDCQSPIEVRDKVKRQLELLISKNQRLPGSMWRALLERFHWFG